jgi:hypothetical protein
MKHSQNGLDINSLGRIESCKCMKRHQGDGYVQSNCIKVSVPSSYASHLYVKSPKMCNVEETNSRMKETLPKAQIGPVVSSKTVYRHMLIPEKPLQPIPAAPHRLRIRRRSMREETVELLAVLDGLLHRPLLNSRKKRDNTFISVVADLKVTDH